jgi:DNA ligase-1
MDSPILYKRTTSGGIQTWKISVLPIADGTAMVVTTFGLLDGKQQRQEEHIKTGKNAGKANATTPLQQATLEAAAEHKKKLDRKGYGLDTGAVESAAKRAAAPMLAKVFEDYRDDVDWSSAFCQPKLDGHRMLARMVDGRVELVSREGKAVTTLPHLAEQLAECLEGLNGCTLDGELWTPDLTFQQIASAVKRQQDNSELVKYHVYDYVDAAPFSSRTESVLDILSAGKCSAIVQVPTFHVHNADDVSRLQSSFLADGYEGAMLRHGSAGYEAGKRSKSLLKCKTMNSAEFEITGVVEGRGTHASMAVLQCRTVAGALFDVTSAGTHADKKQAWLDREKLIGRKLTVKFFEWTTSDQPVPRFPVAERIYETV